MNRRVALIGSCLLASYVALQAPATYAAEDYPKRTISIVCAFPPGSGADVLVRYFADRLAERAKTSVIVENKPGATGNIAATYVVRSKPDGYTIYLHGPQVIAANLNILKNPPFKPEDFQVVSYILRQAFMVSVPANSPVKTLPELTALLRQKGDKASYGVTAVHARIVGELYKQNAGVNPTQVLYRNSADSVNDMISGSLDFGVFDPVFAISQQREGRMRTVAIASGERMSTSPDIPTMQEGGVPEIDMVSFFAAMVPAATPRPIVEQLNVWFNQVVAAPETREFLARNGAEPYLVDADKGQAMFLQAVKDYKVYIQRAGIPQE